MVVRAKARGKRPKKVKVAATKGLRPYMSASFAAGRYVSMLVVICSETRRPYVRGEAPSTSIT